MEQLPAWKYTVFGDYRPTQQVLVRARSVIIVFALYANSLRSSFDANYLLLTNVILGGVILLNIYLHWQVYHTWRISLPVALVSSVIDTTGIMLVTASSGTPAFTNPLFAAIYTIVIASALVFPHRLALTYAAVVALCFSFLSLAVAPGVYMLSPIVEKKVLVARRFIVLAVGSIGSVIVQMERTLRYQAVEAPQVGCLRRLAGSYRAK